MKNSLTIASLIRHRIVAPHDNCRLLNIFSTHTEYFQSYIEHAYHISYILELKDLFMLLIPYVNKIKVNSRICEISLEMENKEVIMIGIVGTFYGVYDFYYSSKAIERLINYILNQFNFMTEVINE